MLVLAFACDPYGGSEPAAGWAVVRSVAQVADVVVLVPPYDDDNIRRWLKDHPNEHIQPVSVPSAGERSGFLTRLVGFDRRVWFLKYFLWLREARRMMHDLEARQPFDASLHAAYGCYWLPSPLWRMKAPAVWGPVGGGTRSPVALWPCMGLRGIIGEWQKIIALKLGCLLPATRRTWRNVAIAITETENSRRALAADVQPDTRVINRCFLADVNAPQQAPQQRESYLLFPSSLEARKAPRLAVRALAQTPPSVKLIFVADGYESNALRRLARKLNVADRVEFRGRVPREQLFNMMAQTAGVVFTGVREEGGMALAEAMTLGAPIIVLGHGGALQLAQCSTDPSRTAIIKPTTLAATTRDLAAAMTQFSANPSTAVGSYLDPADSAAALHQAIYDAIAMAQPDAPALRRVA